MILTENNIEYVSKLYEKLFNTNFEDSKEYSIFVSGNLNPLRYKIENLIVEFQNIVLFETNLFFKQKLDIAYELDCFLTDLIINDV